uniref:Uncharacterized protein n=1 Tax=Arundo donax TaxID=35708 RepID=A0A0A9FLT3_ARUDO
MWTTTSKAPTAPATSQLHPRRAMTMATTSWMARLPRRQRARKPRMMWRIHRTTTVNDVARGAWDASWLARLA